ncbi:hypothetical protein FG152_24640 [Ochrobactrum sp. XJ1]|nr:hypothetical protein [Ochrobactrum sp. XJ1]
MRTTFPREFHLPKGAIKVSDKLSDAVAYLYKTSSGKLAASVFFGNQSKPVSRFSYESEDHRRRAISAAFQARRNKLAYKLEQRNLRNATPRTAEVGAIYYTSWGYDQTNVDFYEIVDLVGKLSAKVRKIGSINASDGSEGWGAGKSLPAAGEYKSEAQTVRITGDRFKIDGNRAHRWHGRPVSWTNYA